MTLENQLIELRDETFTIIDGILPEELSNLDFAFEIEESIAKAACIDDVIDVMTYNMLVIKTLENLKSDYVLENLTKKVWNPEMLVDLDKYLLNPTKWQQIQDSRLPKNIKKERKMGVNICKQCKSWYTTFTQAQTRSADEGITTFVQCEDCGYRYKFN